MTSYAFWNNKGGVGKSFLCFVAACEYAHRHPDVDVCVIDLCPQANVSETLLGGNPLGPEALKKLLSSSPRCSVAGYLEARLNSPFKMIKDIGRFITKPRDSNPYIPRNLILVSGDNILELLAEAIRQTSQLLIPTDAWRQVVTWIQDLTAAIAGESDDRDAVFFLDCNPSFSIYTQLALVAADRLVIPFTADDSSRRGIENIAALMYGIGDKQLSAYAKISFAKRAKEEGVQIPKLHTFVSNRVTMYEGKASKAFTAVAKTIKTTIDDIHLEHRNYFSDPRRSPSKDFIEIPDYHSACIVAAMKGLPLHALKAGPHDLFGERVQVNPNPLIKYKAALGNFVDRL